MVYSGSLEVWQKFDDVINIFKKFKNVNSNVQLLVLTKDVENAKYYLHKNKVEENSFKVKHVKHKDLYSELEKCDIALLVRENNLVNRVSSPIKFSEYLISGLFVIMSDDIGDASSIIKNNGNGFVFKSIDELTENVIKDIMKKCKQGKYKKLSRSIAFSFYNLEDKKQKYNYIYQNLINGGERYRT